MCKCTIKINVKGVNNSSRLVTKVCKYCGKEFVIPAVLLMALIQVILQFYYFMHMKHPGHGTAKLMMLSGLFIAGTFVVMALYITWLGEPLLK